MPPSPPTPDPAASTAGTAPSQAPPTRPDLSPTAGWVLTLAAVGAAPALAVAVVAIVVAGGGSNDGDAALEAGGATGTQTVEVELGEFYLEPASIEIPADTELRVTITNAGELAHDLELEGTTGSDLIDAGETVTAELGVIEASTQAWCTVPGHKEAGWCSTSRSPAPPPPDRTRRTTPSAKTPPR